MFRRFPARQNAVGKGERQMGLYALRGEACATLGDGGSGCRKPVFCRTRRVCTGEGEVCRNPGAGVGELCTPGCFAGAEGGLSCVRFVRLHGTAAARGLVAGEAFSPGVCGKEEGVPLKR